MSEVRTTTVSNLAGTGPVTLTGQSSSKIWILYDLNGTATINNSFNIASLTDNGVGDATVNFTNNMANANYVETYGGGTTGSLTAAYYGRTSDNQTAPSVSAIRSSWGNSGSGGDPDRAPMTIHGDLA